MLNEIAAKFGTPCYVYSKQTIEENCLDFSRAFAAQGKPYKIFYAVKANSNLSILSLIAQQGFGFDAVSGGEIERIMAAGGKAEDIIFSGVGKSSEEIARAIDLDIHSIHIESEAELLRVQEIADKKNKRIGIAIRINPDISANSHPYISTGGKQNKFGIEYTKAMETYLLAQSLANLRIIGISCHIGSQITELQPFLEVIDQLLDINKELSKHGIQLEYIDIGGGLGVRYQHENPPSVYEYAQAVTKRLKDSPLKLHIEPGRAIIAKAGVLLTKVEYLKNTAEYNFAIVDAAMNDLIRPALYDSYHAILPLVSRDASSAKKYSIVGPVCESGDFIAKDRVLALEAGDLLAIQDCGAYGFSMSSNYNTRPRAAEVLVADNKIILIRARETIEQLFANEILPNAN